MRFVQKSGNSFNPAFKGLTEANENIIRLSALAVGNASAIGRLDQPLI